MNSLAPPEDGYHCPHHRHPQAGGLTRLAPRETPSEILLVSGRPEYCPRFGFVPARGHGILCPFEVPDGTFLVLALRKGALSGRSGAVRYQPESCLCSHLRGAP